MELFDKKFVYLEWDDVLKGKKVLAGDNLQFMRNDVNDGTGKFMCVEAYNNSSNSSELYPFKDDNGTTWALVYYDPNYSCKVAYAQGKTIQCKPKDSSVWWADCVFEPEWVDTCEYRVKPDEKAKMRRMTNRELAKWVWQGNGQVKHRDGKYTLVACTAYDIRDDDKPCPDCLVIRGWDETEWSEPIVEG